MSCTRLGRFWESDLCQKTIAFYFIGLICVVFFTIVFLVSFYDRGKKISNDYHHLGHGTACFHGLPFKAYKGKITIVNRDPVQHYFQYKCFRKWNVSGDQCVMESNVKSAFGSISLDQTQSVNCRSIAVNSTTEIFVEYDKVKLSSPSVVVACLCVYSFLFLALYLLVKLFEYALERGTRDEDSVQVPLVEILADELGFESTDFEGDEEHEQYNPEPSAPKE
jgi:hypothetical protein